MPSTPQKVRDKKILNQPRKRIAESHDNSDSESSSEGDWEWINADIGTYEKPAIQVIDSDVDEISIIQAENHSGPKITKRKVIGARKKNIQFRIGDAVSVNCGDPVPLVALIGSFDIRPGKRTRVNILCKLSH